LRCPATSAERHRLVEAVAMELPGRRGRQHVSGDVVMATAATRISRARPAVCAVGLRDVVVVDTPDALLVCDRTRRRRSRTGGELNGRDHESHRLHRTVARRGHLHDPAGRAALQIKRIEVKPGARCRCRCTITAASTVVVSGTAGDGGREGRPAAPTIDLRAGGQPARLRTPAGCR